MESKLPSNSAAPTTATPMEIVPPAKVAKKTRRGKPASDKRREDFVHKAGVKAQAARLAKINSELHDVSDVFSAYTKAQEIGTATSNVVPCTTRGLGFLTSWAWRNAQNLFTTVDVNTCTVFHLYRYTLMQYARQASLVERSHVHPMVIPVNSERTSALRSTANFVFTAEAINQCGSLFYEQVNYRPSFPPAIYQRPVTYTRRVSRPPSPEYHGVTPEPMPTTTVTTRGGKRPRLTTQERPVRVPTPAAVYEEEVVEDRPCPDPFFINIQELREVVLALGNESTPIEWRRRFRELNPIPGAVFQNDLLMNAAAIMPHNFPTYLRSHWDTDQEIVGRYFDSLKIKKPSLIASVNLDGKGSEAMLTAIHSSDMSILNPGAPARMFATRPMQGTAMLRGFIGLMNEPPLFEPVRDALDSTYAIRAPELSCHAMDSAWQTLVTDASPFKST